MDFDLTEEQVMLQDMARSFFEKECDSVTLRELVGMENGFRPEMWTQMAELGWMGLLIPEAYGGFDMGYDDMVILLREIGYACFPGPYFSTAVAGAALLLEAGSEAQKQEILPGVAAGETFLAVAWTEAGGGYGPEDVQLKAEKSEDGYLLSGTKLFVPDAGVADLILCVARTETDDADLQKGLTLFAVKKDTPGITLTQMKTYTGEKLFKVEFKDVKVNNGDLLGEENRAWDVLQKVIAVAAVGKCAEMAGGAQKILEMAVDYAKEREQFGQPIGSFQAIQHHCANILTLADTSKLLTYEAGWKIRAGLPFEMDASMCKAWASESYRQIVMLGIQVLGGTGFMEEHDMHLYYNRAKAAELAYGDADFHREIVARQMEL